MKTRQLPFPVAAALLALALAPAARAGIIYNYSPTLDLTTGVANGPDATYWYVPGHFDATAPSFTLQTGDTLTGTVSFANGLGIQVHNPTSSSFNETARLFLTSNDPANYSTNVLVTLLDPQGQLTGPNPAQSSTGANGAYFLDAGYYGLTPDTVSFYGFTYSIEMLSGSGTFTPQDLDVFSWSGNSNISVVSAVSPVPEPATGLAGIAAGAIALFSRQRRRQFQNSTRTKHTP